MRRDLGIAEGGKRKIGDVEGGEGVEGGVAKKAKVEDGVEEYENDNEGTVMAENGSENDRTEAVNQPKPTQPITLAALLSKVLQPNPSITLQTSTAPTKPRKPKFCLIHAIARDPSLMPNLIACLPLPSIISLYAISKPFHYYFNLHHTASILASTRTWAPQADTIFPWRCYKRLCIKDPAAITKARLSGREADMKKKWAQIRDVPSLRWLQMVVWREGVVQDMLIVMRGQGLLCPPGTLEAVKRMWFLMDLPLNSQRLALIRDKTYLPDHILRLFSIFLLKVDMLLTDPLHPAYPINHANQRFFPRKDNGTSVSGVGLRKLLLAERQLTPLWRVVRGWTPDPKEPARPMTRLDMLRLWVRHKYVPKEDLPDSTKKMSIMGIPWFEVGTAGLERTGVTFVGKKKDGGDEVDGDSTTTAKPAQAAAMISHTQILPSASTPLQQQQLNARSKIHTQARASMPDEVLSSTITSQGKPREPLLRPDELVMRESVRRGFKTHKMWVKWMLWGFCGADGMNFPLLSEDEWLSCLRGNKRRDVVEVDVPEEVDAEDGSEEDDDDMSGMTDISGMSDDEDEEEEA